MVVTTTTAASLAAGSALADSRRRSRDRSVITLTLFVGILMVAVGLLQLGRYIRFVSRSVMVGFLTGVAVNIVLRPAAGSARVDNRGPAWRPRRPTTCRASA